MSGGCPERHSSHRSRTSWESSVVEPDTEGMLRRVALDVFDEDIDVAFEVQPSAPHVSRARLGTGSGADLRTAGLRAASTGWFDVTIFDLDVSATHFEYDDESYMEGLLRELALVADAYLRGAGHIEYKRRLLRTKPVLIITVNGREWALGRRTSRVHYPEDTSPGDGTGRSKG
jgi:hypothetical protein